MVDGDDRPPPRGSAREGDGPLRRVARGELAREKDRSGDAPVRARGEGERGSWSWPAWLITTLGRFPPIRVNLRKVPSLQRLNEPESLPQAELEAGFDAIEQRMTALLAAAQGAPRRVKRQHPLIGWMNARQWYVVAAAHLKHHLRQVR